VYIFDHFFTLEGRSRRELELAAGLDGDLPGLRARMVAAGSLGLRIAAIESDPWALK